MDQAVSQSFCTAFGLAHPIIQAPMAGTSTPAMAAAVSNAGGLGSIAIGAMDAHGADKVIAELKSLTGAAFNVNVFAHRPAQADAAREARWLEALAPLFEAHGAPPPAALNTIYKSFDEDEAMLDVLIARAPRVVSFHFGLPRARKIQALKDAGCVLFASATNLYEALACEAAGIDAIVAQGFEAGGHRGVFDPDAPDEKLGALQLTRTLVRETNVPIIAAGGIMDGAGIAEALRAGAVAAQLGTAFIACAESSASAAHRDALFGEGAARTLMTRAISGRPARCLPNAFTAWEAEHGGLRAPDYPRAYDAGKALHKGASAKGEHGFGAHWAGAGASRARAMGAAEIVATLAQELESAWP